ncbi:hypothetical protein GCM10027162_16600 [Streptomyces incanus]
MPTGSPSRQARTGPSTLKRGTDGTDGSGDSNGSGDAGDFGGFGGVAGEPGRRRSGTRGAPSMQSPYAS